MVRPFVRIYTFFVWVVFITYTDKKWRSMLKVNLHNGNISKL